MDGAGKLLWGYYKAGVPPIWVPLQVDENGKVIVDMSAINLGDLANVDVSGVADDDFFYYDLASGLWKPRKLVDADIPAGIARDAEVVDAIDDHAGLTTDVHGLKGEVGFSVYQTSNQTIPHQTATIVDWHAKDWDVGNYFDLTNNWYKPLVAGKYLLTCAVQVKLLAAGKSILLNINKNGATYKMVSRLIPGAQEFPQLSGSCIIPMNGSTDYADLIVYHYDTVDRETHGENYRVWFQGILLAQT